MTDAAATTAAARRRTATLERLAGRPFDLLIVGGGATGAATARDAALRGLEVALVEAGDFAGQTSSHSSKLIHGGLRYLQYGNLKLVFEGLTERAHLMRIAPHLCRPIEFLFPAYHGESPGLATLGVGIALYDALALWRAPTSSRRVRPPELAGLVPHLRGAGLSGGYAYVDCQTDDARLVLENVLDAETAGATVANHAFVESLVRDRRGRVHGASVRDVESGARFEARARIVVSAAGPFTDRLLGDDGAPRLRPTLGVHLVFDAERVPHGGRALVLRTPGDNRLFFCLPAGARTIVGTTDTDWAPAESPRRAPRLSDDVRARGEDVAYLLAAANHAFPSLRLGSDDVVSTFAGLRPLLATAANTPSETSREHEIARGPDGVLSVVGGKLTTLRRMAEETVDAALDALRAAGFEGAVAPCATARRPLPGGGPALQDDPALDPDVKVRLAGAYGSRASELTALYARVPDLASRIVPDFPYLWAEVVHAARAEHARDVADVLCRRVPLSRDARDQGLGAAARTGAILAEELGWNEARRTRSIADFHEVVACARRWREELKAP